MCIRDRNTLDLPTDDTQPEEYWKINIYYQVVDNIIVNLKRFENLPLANAVDAFLKLDLKNGEDFINNYKNLLKIDTSALNAETMIMKNMLQSKKDEVNEENLRKHIKKEYCPNLYKLLQVAIALPVSSANCERSFSAMRRIKTWLRTTMLQERLDVYKRQVQFHLMMICGGRVHMLSHIEIYSPPPSKTAESAHELCRTLISQSSSETFLLYISF